VAVLMKDTYGRISPTLMLVLSTTINGFFSSINDFTVPWQRVWAFQADVWSYRYSRFPVLPTEWGVRHGGG
jgi:hypothetical protein